MRRWPRRQGRCEARMLRRWRLTLKRERKLCDDAVKPATVASVGAVVLDLERGKITAIMGPSGTGKTTLLKLIGGQLSAGGDIDLTPNQTLSGKINAEMAVQSRRFHAKLSLSGNPKQPQLK